MTITDDVRSSTSVFHEPTRGYDVIAIVRNRSDIYLEDRVTYAMNAPQRNGSIPPHFWREGRLAAYVEEEGVRRVLQLARMTECA